MTIWSLILFASSAVGIFLLSVLLVGSKSNSRATYLFSALLAVLIATNIDNWLYASGLWVQFLTWAGFSRGCILLIGPLLLLYAQSISDPGFRLRRRHLLHLIPYLAAAAYLFPLIFLSSQEQKTDFIQGPLETSSAMPNHFRVVLALYLVHVGVYLGFTLRLIGLQVRRQAALNLVVPVTHRARWLKHLAVSFATAFLVLAIPMGWVIVTGHYRVEVNFAITTLYSLLIYYLGVAVFRSEAVVLPGFDAKYATVPANQGLTDTCARKLTELFDERKVYLDPDLTLGRAADLIGIPPGYLSKHINEQIGKSFPDLVNSYRIEEFKRRFTDPRYQNFTILGLAMDVGFSSKSSFQAAFKKITGRSPSDLKASKN